MPLSVVGIVLLLGLLIFVMSILESESHSVLSNSLRPHGL